MFMRLLRFYMFVVLAFSFQSSRSEDVDPRVEVVKGIQYSSDGKIIIRDLFKTSNSSDGIIALLPLLTVNGYKDVLVWIPNLSGSTSDSKAELFELPVDKNQLRFREDFSLITGQYDHLSSKAQSFKFKWTAGGETGYMTTKGSKLYFWVKGAVEPLVFERASTKGEKKGDSSPWEYLRNRMIKWSWFGEGTLGKVLLFNAGPISTQGQTGLESYLSTLDQKLKYSVIALSTEHEQSIDSPEEKMSVRGFKSFAIVIENEANSDRPNFLKSNLIGVRSDGTHEVFPGVGRIGLQNPSFPTSAPNPHIGFQTGPDQVVYIDETVFDDIAKDSNIKRSPIYGNNRWSLISGFGYTFVYLITSDDGRTIGTSANWKIAKFRSKRDQAEETIGRSYAQQVRQMPNRFVDKLKEARSSKKSSCLGVVSH